MTDAMRELLDDLMGQERDVPLVERKNKSLTFSDPAICKFSLAGLCPYRLFTNTKSFLGTCKYDIHPGELRYEPVEEEWAKLSDEEKERYGYERELHGVLSHLVKDMDRHIERQWERANKENQPRPISAADKERLETLKDQQMEALVKSEKAAEGGDVDESMKFAEEAEAFGEEHATLEKSLTQVERTMAVCNTCGVFINSTDNDARKHEHLQGKQYLGWLEIREKLKELSELLKARDAAGTSHRPPEKERDRDRRERDREGRSRDRERDGRERDREYKDRDRRRRSRSAERHRSGRSDRRSDDDRRRSRDRDTRHR